MSSEFGNDLLSISDEEGNNYLLEHLDTIEFDGCYYLSFLPADMDENDPDYGFVYLKQEPENLEDFMVPTEEELEIIHEIFMQRLMEAEDEE